MAPTEPAESPVATASPNGLDVREASALAGIPDCQNPLGWDYLVSGNDLFVVCDAAAAGGNVALDDTGPYVARVDLTTDKVTATYRYRTPITYIEAIEVAGGNLWFDGIFGGSGCAYSRPGDCDGWQRTERFDLATGKNVQEIRNASLVGSAFGYVWVKENGYGDASLAHRLRKLDPATGRQIGTIPFSMDGAWFACGSLYGTTVSNSSAAAESTALARIDPASGKILARFSVPGEIGSLGSAGGACWASAAPGSEDPDASGFADRFLRIGKAGVEFESPRFEAGVVRDSAMPGTSGNDVWEGSVSVFGGAFWLVRDDLGSNASLQRIDPATWRVSGPVWVWSAPPDQGGPFAIAGDAVWSYDQKGGIVRLDIPLRP